MKRLFGTDGVRGVAAKELTPELALAIGKALGALLTQERSGGKARVLIGADTRISSDLLVSAISAGLASLGCDCYLLGVVPTPAVAYAVTKSKADAGVMISASHNPYQYNGIKIFNSDGFKLPDEDEDEIERLIESGEYSSLSRASEELGRIFDRKDLVKDYIDYVRSTSRASLDGLKVAIDCARGAAVSCVKEIFSDTGADIRYLFDDPDGININRECGSTHMSELSKFVKENGFDIGIAFDGDADRCLATDENGNEVDGDFLMAILAEAMKRGGGLRKNTVVGTVMANCGFARFCEDAGINFLSTNVGDRFVLEAMESGGYSLGGEQSGHIILREYATTGDGQLTALHILAELKESGKSLSELASVMKKYPQYTVNVSASAEEKEIFLKSSAIKEIKDAAEARLRGHGRIIARPSGTEPLIRITVEDKDARLACEICSVVARESERILRPKAD